MSLRAISPLSDVRIPTRRIRCPKCGKPPTNLREVGRVYMDFDAGDGWRTEEGYQSVGDVEFVIASCTCGHRWKLRGAVQITSIDVDVACPSEDCWYCTGEACKRCEHRNPIVDGVRCEHDVMERHGQ